MCYNSVSLQYRILLDSFFYWLGCCRPCLLKKKRILSTVEMAINKDPNLISDFDATYDEVHVLFRVCIEWLYSTVLYCRRIYMM